MVDVPHTPGVESQRRVEPVVPDTVAETRRRGLISLGIDFIGVGPHHQQRIRMVGRQRRFELRERRTGRQPGFVEPLDERRLGHGDQLRRRRNFGQQRQQVFVLPPRRGIELVVAVDVGLDDAPLGRPLVGLLPAPPDAQRHGGRKEQDARGRDPPPDAAACPQRLEEEDITEQHPQRTAEDTRVFVPLYEPYVVREPVAQDQPRPREFADRIPVFRCDPPGNE